MSSKKDRLKKHPDTMLAAWDASMTPDIYKKLASLQARRNFISGMVKSAALVSSLPLWFGLQACDRKTANEQLLNEHPWSTFAAVQQHLFPADDNGPSASDINATLYLKFVLQASDTDEDDKKFLLDGIKWLNDLAEQQNGKPFIKLADQQQHQVMTKIAASNAGERWLSHLLLYIVEALLTDPVYGGNPNGIGWQWLQHQAGFPTPPVNKRYMDLL